jgi:DNA-binding NtrC family response regulator
VRELEHAIERALILASEEAIQPEDLPQNIHRTQAEENSSHLQYYLNLPFKEAKERLIEDFESRYIVDVLKKYQGNISRSAAHSGIDRRSLHRLLAKYEIEASQVVKED